MNINALSAGTSTPQAGGKENPGRIKEAAEQFEALLITTMLRAAKENESGGWMGGGEDQSLAPAVGMAEEQLASSMAKQGGLGLSKVILEQLQRLPKGVSA